MKMEINDVDSAFSKSRRSCQEDYLFRNVQWLNAMPHGIGAVNTHTNSDGHFMPVRHMVLVNRYRIVSCIETSGQSAVLVEAEDYFNKMLTVGIKVMHTSYLAVGIKEVQTLRKINSLDPFKMSHTIHLLNSFRFKDHICLVFPLLNPLPLNYIIAKKFLHEDEILSAIRKIGLHLLSVLDYLRSLNIIHADIKPDNILLEQDEDINTITLIDFGNAIHHTHSELSLYYSDFELQTQPYRAPEVHLGYPFSMEVDMWSLGCVLMELLTGQLIFSGNSRADSLRKMVTTLGPLPADMCRRGKFFHEVESIVTVTHSSHSVENGAQRLMSAFPCVKNYEFFHFLSGLLTYHPDQRMTPWEALQHPFMTPVINIPHFFTEAAYDTSVIRKSHYNSTTVQQYFCPSTFNLLDSGTYNRGRLGRHSNVSVESLGYASRIGKEEDYQQYGYERNYCTVQRSGNNSISGKKNSYNNNVHRSRRCVSPEVNDLEMFSPVKYGSLEQIKCNPVLSHQSYIRRPVWGKSRRLHRFKDDQIKSSHKMFTNQPKCAVVQNACSKKAHLDHRNNSEDKPNQKSQPNDISHVHLTNQTHSFQSHYKACDDFINIDPMLGNSSSSATCHTSQSLMTGDLCEANSTSYPHTAIFIKDQSRHPPSTDMKKTLSSEIKDTEVVHNENYSETLLFSQVTSSTSTGYKCLRKRENNESHKHFDYILTQDTFSEIIPLQDDHVHPPTKYYREEVHSLSTNDVAIECEQPIRKQRCPYLQNCSRQVDQLVCKNHKIIKVNSETPDMKNLVSINSGMLSTTDRKNEASEEVNPKQRCIQNQSPCLAITTLCTDTDSARIDIEYSEMTVLDENDNSYNKENPELIENGNSCNIEKTELIENGSSYSTEKTELIENDISFSKEKAVLDENDNSYNNHYQKHDLIRTYFQKTKTECSQSLDTEEVLLLSSDDSTEGDDAGSSSLDLIQEFQDSADKSNEMNVSLTGRGISGLIDNYSHIPTTGLSTLAYCADEEVLLLD